MRSTVALVAASLLGPGLAGQGRSTEVDAGGLAAWARHAFYGASLGVSRRPGSQSRVALTLAAGSCSGRAALRLEAMAHFLVTPGARQGISPYGGMGVAYVGVHGRAGSGALVVALGLEAAEGTPHGWFGEVGLGGGVRMRMGYRWRRLPPW